MRSRIWIWSLGSSLGLEEEPRAVNDSESLNHLHRPPTLKSVLRLQLRLPLRSGQLGLWKRLNSNVCLSSSEGILPNGIVLFLKTSGGVDNFADVGVVSENFDGSSNAIERSKSVDTRILRFLRCFSAGVISELVLRDVHVGVEAMGGDSGFEDGRGRQLDTKVVRRQPRISSSLVSLSPPPSPSPPEWESETLPLFLLPRIRSAVILDSAHGFFDIIKRTSGKHLRRLKAQLCPTNSRTSLGDYSPEVEDGISGSKLQSLIDGVKTQLEELTLYIPDRSAVGLCRK